MSEKKQALKKDFEKELKRLEEIVALLEKGDSPLDESIKLFEEGIEKASDMKKNLEESKRKIEIISKKSGLFTTEKFGDDEI
ncbi:exodeoxyribonuclease VII small subunit [bacterium]|nr:exodeoxyribonuclease VII small subunit [bacterium]MBU3955875.1 exodeoxyribonuclease VII small subunit [bacterium]MBU4134508.1 exodeoxyribonuclease VII small subunit [bacterium]